MSAPSTSPLLVARHHTVPSNLSVSYESEGGLHVVAGRGCTLYGADGVAYLDGVNNVAHVGHSNPHVLQRMQQQQCAVNTNTRYLSSLLPEYTTRLLATFPAPLSSGKCILTCSGSEANDLAMRVCRAHAQARRTRHAPPSPSADVFVCLSHGYHGATDSVVSISPYKYLSPGGRGRVEHIIEVALPHCAAEEASILQRLAQQIQQARAQGSTICGFFGESVLSCAGQVWLSPSFVQGVYALVRAAGGLCVADEVQTGFGRMGGPGYWAFESLRGVTPDLISLGKGMGNGYPLAGVIGSREALQAFEGSVTEGGGVEYFNSNAGTNVACAAGLAVLEVIEAQGMVEHAHRVGGFMLQRLRALRREYAIIHAVRGQGLFLGIELRLPTGSHTDAAASLATAALASSMPPPSHLRLPSSSSSVVPYLAQLPRRTLPHAGHCAATHISALPSSSSAAGFGPGACPSLSAGSVTSWLVTALMLCRPLGVLVGSDGPAHNVLKIKPPMLFNERDAEYTVACLRVCLDALRALHPCCFTNKATAVATVNRAKL